MNVRPLDMGEPVPVQISRSKVLKSRQIVWKNNAPIVEVVEIIPKEVISDMAGAALSMPYLDPDDIDEPRFKGRSCVEVTLMKIAEEAASRGDRDALNLLLDRFIGKPKQSIESKKVTVNYSDYLKMQAEVEKQGNSKL